MIHALIGYIQQEHQHIPTTAGWRISETVYVHNPTNANKFL
jgi:hypothetical protein